MNKSKLEMKKKGDEPEGKHGGLGRNPLGSISQTGLEGLLSGGKKHEEPEQDLSYTKAVKLTQDDLEFLKDMAIALHKEGNFSEAIRACIRAARKKYGKEVRELAEQRKSLGAIEI